MRSKAVFAAAIGLLLAAASAQPEPRRHEDGSIHYYGAVGVPRGISWSRAGDSARALGGYLATLTSPEENAFVFGLTDSDGLWNLLPGGELVGPWIGARQPAGSPEPGGGWSWLTDEQFRYSNWSSGEPDNDLGANVASFGATQAEAVPTWNDRAAADSSVTGFVAELSADRTTVGLLKHDSGASPGYTLFAPMASTTTYLIDNNGRLVHSWQSTSTPGLSAYLLEGGDLLRTACVGNERFTAGGAGGRIEKYDWQGGLVWSYDYSTPVYCQHHDIEPLPNGNILMVAWEYKTRTEAIAAGRNPSLLPFNMLWPDHVVEVDPSSDSIVWEWHLWDHLVQDYDSTKANYGVVADHPELMDLNYIIDNPDQDWIHTNSIDYNPALDQIVLSSRMLSEIWVIDHSTTTAEAAGHSGGRQGMGGDILYRWGNPQGYRAGASTDRRFFGQHDARWIESGMPGSGHLVVFDNGFGRPGGSYSTVEELVPPVDSTGRYARPAPGVAYGPDAPCWVYCASPPESLYSWNISGADRLPNGNTLVCEGAHGDLTEVTPAGTTVWRYLNPVTPSGVVPQGDDVPASGTGIFRATRYAPDFAGFAGRDMTPGFPIERYQTPALATLEPDARARPGAPRCSVWPSPFSAVTTVRFQLSEAQTVRLVVFDQSGRAVRVLASAWFDAGAHDAVWDGRAERGAELPTGVYFCRLQAEADQSTTRVALVRP